MFEDNPSNEKQAAPPANLPSEPVDMFSGVENDAASNVEGVAPVRPPNAVEAGVLKKKEAPITTMPTESKNTSSPDILGGMDSEARQPVIGKILKVIGLIVAVGGIGAGGVYAYQLATKKSSTALPVVTNQNSVVKPAVQAVPTTPPPASMPAPAVATSAPATSLSSTTSAADAFTTATNNKILFGDQTDSDHDGLTDSEEINIYHTDPHNPDTDGDGLTDGDEVKKYHTDPLNIDTDGDGLTDGAEVNVWHTDPLNPDTDGDGHPDGMEVYYGYDPLGPGKLPPGTATGTGVIFRPGVTSTIKATKTK